MSYVGTITRAMLGNLKLDPGFITKTGTSHGANPNFPVELYTDQYIGYKRKQIDYQMWLAWYWDARSRFTVDGTLVVKDGWYLYGDDNWSRSIDSIDDSFVIVSSPNDRLDWIYCYLQMSRKIRRHLYCSLREKSNLYPKLWDKLRKDRKINEMKAAMPSHQRTEHIITRHPLLRFKTTDIFQIEWPLKLLGFLKDQGFDAELPPGFDETHSHFIAAQIDTYNRAIAINASHASLQPSTIWEEILFDYLDKDVIDP